MADSAITFDTSLDNSQLEKDVKQAQREIDSLKRQIERKEAARSFVEQQMDESQESIRRTREEVAKLEKELAGLETRSAIDPSDTEAWFSADTRAAEVRQRIGEANDELATQEKHQASLERRWDTLDRSIGEYNAQLGAANSRAEALGQSYSEAQAAASGMGSSLSSGMAEAESRMNAVQRKIGQMVKRVFLLSVATMGLRHLRSLFADALMGNAQLEAAVNGLKATFSGLVNYVAGVVAPVLVGMANAAAAAIRALASVVDSIFGTNITASIAAAQQAVSATKAATKATKGQAKATKQLAKEQRSLMSFDELHRLDDTSDPSGGDVPGAGGGAGGAGAGGFDVGQISDKVAEIMLILGAGIMAVGAILAFSGINIPLGISLMVIGALMVYAAYRERWDELPQKVRDAITGAIMLTGIVLLVLGVVLAFSSPAHAALGIGMMAAGAALLWTAVALNWDTMPAHIKTAVSVAMGVLSVALLVIGAIIAFSSPAHAALGIALMVAGAVSLAAAVAINWDSMPERVRVAVVAIAAIVGVAFLVIGAVLAFSSPANVPLGIALMALGAAAIVSAAIVAWNALPQNIRGTVFTIMGIIGGALLVLGLILVATGNFPLGIGLMLAGGLSLAAAIAPNWGAIRQRIVELWNGIRQWFNTTVRPIFTVQWWGNLFRSIVNGLILRVNNGLNAFGNFINSIASGISGILNFLGVRGWSFRIRMPQIPYLAQGAVIPPNREFMAVLGDQRHGNNIEAPEALMRQVVREEAGAMVAQAMLQLAAQQDSGGGDVTMVLQVDSETLAVAVERGRAAAARRGVLSADLALV